MGAYDRRSHGCYVLTHGVGEGYKLWGNEGLPRWFSRVWTLQEFMLPCRLSFFVEALDTRFLEFVDEVVKAQSKRGLCRCFCKLGRYELVRPFLRDRLNNQGLSWALGFDLCDEGQIFQRHQALNSSFRFMTSTSVLPMKAEASQGNEEGGIIQVDGDRPPNQNLDLVASMDTNVWCTQCQSLPMIRRAQRYACNSSSDSSNQTSTIYLVDREAYFGLMQCHSRMMEPTPIGCSKGVEELLGLYGRLRKKIHGEHMM
ncbi:hypothetical protein L7F22_018173 [Adiantum nelumboides]|nr:hypothetical protein [Adiantum nelumboides]